MTTTDSTQSTRKDIVEQKTLWRAIGKTRYRFCIACGYRGAVAWYVPEWDFQLRKMNWVCNRCKKLAKMAEETARTEKHLKEIS